MMFAWQLCEAISHLLRDLSRAVLLTCIVSNVNLNRNFNNTTYYEQIKLHTATLN